MIIFLVLAGLSSLWYELHQVNLDFMDEAREAHQTVIQRISNLETVLVSLSGLHHSNDSLSSAEHAAFAQEMLKAYPFISAILHMERVQQEELDNFIERMHEKGFIGYRIRANEQHRGDHSTQTLTYRLPISFIEPMSPLSASLLGHDLADNPNAITAIETAVRTGEITASGAVLLGQTENLQFFILKAIYLGRYPPQQNAEREMMFAGMAALKIDPVQFIEGVITPDSQMALALYRADNQKDIGHDQFAMVDHRINNQENWIVSDLSYSRVLQAYGQPIVLSIKSWIGLQHINWVRVSIIWLIAVMVYILTITLYLNHQAVRHQTKQAAAAIAAEGNRFTQVINTAFDAVITADESGKIVSWNQQASEIFGYTEDEAIGQTLFQLILSPQSLMEKMDNVDPIFQVTGTTQSGTQIEAIGRHKDGQEFPLELAISSSNIGEMFILSIFARDITERRSQEEKIRYLAYYDQLTDLPNRQAFKDQVNRAIKVANRHGRIGAVLYLDLDEFKRINDTLGHDLGDLLLKHVARRLVEHVRESDLVGYYSHPEHKAHSIARLGGDEFTVLLEEIPKPEIAGVIAKRVQDVITDAYHLDGHDVFVTPSIGIAVFPHDGNDVEDLLKNADTAMYHAKSLGKNNYQFYTEKMNALAADRLKLEGKLRSALSNNEMALYYQPQIDLVSGRLVSAEALLRWKQTELGMIPPNEFIPLAEETGIIHELGEWVINEACRQNKCWQEAGYKPIRVAINLSSMQFLQRNLNDQIARALKKSGLEPRYLEVEITESVIMRNVDETIATLNEFKSMGLSISVDDFGTGYSSLSYLKRFPLDMLKIDRSFIKDIPDDNDDVTITSAIIAMARQLNIQIIAEGVENQSQLDFLKTQGCELAQGYYYNPPLPANEFESLLIKA